MAHWHHAARRRLQLDRKAGCVVDYFQLQVLSSLRCQQTGECRLGSGPDYERIGDSRTGPHRNVTTGRGPTMHTGCGGGCKAGPGLQSRTGQWPGQALCCWRRMPGCDRQLRIRRAGPNRKADGANHSESLLQQSAHVVGFIPWNQVVSGVDVRTWCSCCRSTVGDWTTNLL